MIPAALATATLGLLAACPFVVRRWRHRGRRYELAALHAQLCVNPGPAARCGVSELQTCRAAIIYQSEGNSIAYFHCQLPAGHKGAHECVARARINWTSADSWKVAKS